MSIEIQMDGAIFLSMTRDLYSSRIVAYKAGTEQTANLVLNIIRANYKRRGLHLRRNRSDFSDGSVQCYHFMKFIHMINQE